MLVLSLTWVVARTYTYSIC